MAGRSTSGDLDEVVGEGPPSLAGERTVSFEAVYEQHFRFVWRSLRRLGILESDVADAVQDVFLVVHRRLGEFEGRSKVTTWLYGICYRVARDRRRLAHVRHRAEDDAEMDEHPDERADVAAAAERKQGLELLETILDDLPIEQRAVFTLFELDAMSGDAIAEMLQIPLGTVYSRLRIAREQFRKSLTRLQARDRFRVAGSEVAGGEAVTMGPRSAPNPSPAKPGPKARTGAVERGEGEHDR